MLGELPHVVGIQTARTRELLAPGTVMVGVRLRPGVAAPLLRTSAIDLADLTVGFDSDSCLIATEALRNLPPRQRAAVVLRNWEDLSVEQTARRAAPRDRSATSVARPN